MRERVTAYTDGASCGNPGPGGWAVLLGDRLESGWSPCATNNEMEMLAALMAITLCKAGVTLEIYTDSKLVIGWLKKGWRCLKNQHIEEIRTGFTETLTAKHLLIEWHWVKAHSANYRNAIVDQEARHMAQIARHSSRR